jgi:hypothetical protein
MQVKQLVAPLCYYPESVFDKSHDDEAAADGGEIAITEKAMLTKGYSQSSSQLGQYTRLDGLANRVKKILNLARLLPDRVERTLLCLVLARPAKGVRLSDAVTALYSHLRHWSTKMYGSVGVNGNGKQ